MIMKEWIDGKVTCDFTVFFFQQNFSHIRTMGDDNEKLCAMEPRLRLRRFRLERGFSPGPLDHKASA